MPPPNGIPLPTTVSIASTESASPSIVQLVVGRARTARASSATAATYVPVPPRPHGHRVRGLVHLGIEPGPRDVHEVPVLRAGGHARPRRSARSSGSRGAGPPRRTARRRSPSRSRPPCPRAGPPAPLPCRAPRSRRSDTVPSPPSTATIARAVLGRTPRGRLHVVRGLRDPDLGGRRAGVQDGVGLADQLPRLAASRGRVRDHDDGRGGHDRLTAPTPRRPGAQGSAPRGCSTTPPAAGPTR